MEEEHKSLEYQEIMKVDVENIDRSKYIYGYQYMKLLILHFFISKKIPPEFLDKCKKNPNGPQFLPSKSKIAFNEMAME